ncbi:UBA/TS-N domain [Phytophthora boehmeriae]|uniref:UBA/TS-N domain n=1 Tax=Phytophthora boehmeriae TaxID=109152 RepID=A0A8T1WQX1_9STRA|nr:UBA/TS-N domain [Phytophthora boehmeriae]
MQPTPLEPTPLSSENGPLKSAFGEIVHRGWLNLKTRSMVNVRPRHMRYCILARDTLNLSTFKFQPSTGDLQSGLVKPLRTYKVLGVAPWDGRRFAFLVSVKQVDDHADKVLEIDGQTATAASEWIHHLRVLTSHDDEEEWPPQPSLASLAGSDQSAESPSDAASVVENSKKEANLWVKGASVHRGLLNASGENNCFLNVVIQSFWHLTSMRHFLLHVEVKDESRSVESNVLRALKSMMTEYDDTSSGVLHSRAIRKGLSVLYAADKNFQEGAMYDAEETLLALLNLMHQQTESTEIEETHKTTMMVKSLVRLVSTDTYEEKPQAVFDDNSIPHLVFSHQIYDRYVCASCNHSSPWDLYSNLVYSTYASDLYACKYESTEHMFRRLTAQESDVASKCEQKGCRGKLAKERVIHRFPMVFAVSILWATSSATKEQVEGVLNNIDDRLDLAKCFDAAGPVIRFKNGGLRTTYRLRGFVCYYGRHYVALFYSTAHKMWLLFDDSRVLEMGAWSNVVAECLKGRFQPVLLFYELPDQRKDSSVGIFVNDGTVNVERTKSLSVGSQPGEMMPPSIQEEAPDTERPSLRRQNDADLHSVEEEATLSGERQGGTAGVTELEADHDFEIEELGLRDSITQNITPVSAAIAMCPRTISMNSPLGEGEYDVRFGETLLLGMYLEKVENELCVTSFPRGAKGGMFGAEKSGQIGLFDEVLQANGHPLQHYQVDRALKMIKAQTRPLVIRFRKSKRVQQLLDMGFSREMAVEALQKTNGNVQAAANHCFESTS